jgi:hypothetical protein
LQLDGSFSTLEPIFVLSCLSKTIYFLSFLFYLSLHQKGKIILLRAGWRKRNRHCKRKKKVSEQDENFLKDKAAEEYTSLWLVPV